MAGHTGLTALEGLCQPDLQESVAAWLSALASEKHFSAHTLRAYNSDIRQFLTYLSGHLGQPVALKDISDTALRDFRGYLAKKAMQGNGASTRARALASLRTFFKWLDRNGILHNPNIRLMATPKQPHKVPRPLEATRIFDLLEMVGTDDNWMALRDKALLGLLYGMGLRISEGLNLTIADITAGPDTMRITGKGSKEREVPTIPVIFKLIEAYRAACPYPETPSRPLFLGEKGGKLNAGMVQKLMRQMRIHLGLGDAATPHAMRHSYATHLLGEGMNLREVQTLLGHASLSTTQRYTEVDYKQLLETFKKAHPRA
ncbi:MAG: tyrosine recombinase XerC [Alphaproteobacteria bacterium]|nr:tyrosine recombinase XerC [Alphaproteobacteria bacterium]